MLKAAGCGLDDEVRSLSVSVDAQARIVQSAHPMIAPHEWSLAAIEPPGPWIAAVAARGALPPLRLREWSSWP